MTKPHVVCVPFPLQGHIIPMLKLAKLFHCKGFHVTFVNTQVNHNRILESRGPKALEGLPDFRFETIPLDHSNSHSSQALYLLALRQACRKKFLPLFRDLVVGRLNINSSPVSCPPVTCMVSDFYLSYSIGVSEELGIPNVLLWTAGAAGFLSFKNSRLQMMQCRENLKDPSKRRDGNLESIRQWIPGFKEAQLRDISNLMMQIQDRNEVDSTETDWDRAAKASAIVVHTFEAFESPALRDLSSMFRKIYTIGPLQSLLNQIPTHPNYASMEGSLLNGEPDCVKWLDSKEPNSVIYVCFGSTTVMTTEQIVELAWGLANSKQNFLWVIRSDMITGESTALPPEFVMETKERGFMASWCPQERVLNHPSIGGFVTHCGWNSTMESICAGVPLICWPFFGDQFVNCRNSCNEWGIGMELSSNFKRDEVEKLVEELLTGKKGMKMKNRVMEWKRMAEDATTSAGSSFTNLNNLVNEVMLTMD